VVLAMLCVVTRGEAQRPSSSNMGRSREVDGVWDAYRASVSMLGAAELADGIFRGPVQFRDTLAVTAADHPWAAIARRPRPAWRAGAVVIAPRRPDLQLTWNSALPVQELSGPAWTGRGLTASVRGGVSASWRSLFVQLEPVAWVSQNRAFVLAPNGFDDHRRFNDARFPLNIDLPQRMGAERMSAWHPGNSTMALRGTKFIVGVSSAARAWGAPGSYPLLLGSAAAGFPQAFAETDGDIRTPIGGIRSHLLLGRTGQSAWSPITGDSARRSAAALAISLRPRGLAGVELGAARFLHARAGGALPSPALLGRLLSAGFTGAETDGAAAVNRASENNLASLFVRWAPPGSRVSLNGEYMWEDYANDVRDLLLYPDDLRSFRVQANVVLRSSSAIIDVLDLEVVNGEVPWSNERRARTGGTTPGVPVPPYLHFAQRQGHTHLGMPLGSRGAYGGAAARATLRRQSVTGLTSITLERQLIQDWLRGTRGDSLPARQVRHLVTATRARAGRRVDVSYSLSAMYDLNVNMIAGNDAAHLRASLRVGRIF
jgi:hypothetical protein